MLEKVPSLLSAMVADGFTLESIAGGGIAGFAISSGLAALLTKRFEAARQIFIEEVRRGERHMTDREIEHGVAITYRYFRAAQEGAARLNLRLMAKVIAGRAALGNLVADEFLADADIIASLRRNEIVLLATMYKAQVDPTLGDPREWAQKQLIPRTFADLEEFEATAGAIVRTGLLVPASGWSSIDYELTPLMDRLISLADLEAAMLAEQDA